MQIDRFLDVHCVSLQNDSLDDSPVDIVQMSSGLSVTVPVDTQAGVEKNIHISLLEDKSKVTTHHTLTNRGQGPVECAPWAITQFKTGVLAILPQSQEQTAFLPNRSLAIWPYTDIANPSVSWGNRYILVRAETQTGFKVGFPNPRGWLAYWLAGILFVKRVDYDPRVAYYDFGSSSECYCNDQFLELETLAPINMLAPDESVTHTDGWEFYTDVNLPVDEAAIQTIVDQMGLDDEK